MAVEGVVSGCMVAVTVVEEVDETEDVEEVADIFRR